MLFLSAGFLTVLLLWVYQHFIVRISRPAPRELMACQIVEIMAGESSPAVCANN